MKRLLVSLLIVVGVLSFVSTISFAQSPVKTGMKELNLLVSFSNTDIEDVSMDVTMLMGALGYFLADQHELGVNIAYQSMDFDGEETKTTLAHLFYAFYIPVDSDKYIPYVAAQAGMGSMDLGVDSLDITSYGIAAGVKFFVTPGAAITIQPSYLWQTWEDGESVDANRFGIDAGISMFF